MFTKFCSKFIQDTVHQISAASLEFRRKYYRKHFGLFFLDTVYQQSNAWHKLDVLHVQLEDILEGLNNNNVINPVFFTVQLLSQQNCLLI